MTHKAKQNTDDIKLILRDLLKVIKVVSLYPPDNPLPQSMKNSFAEKLVDLVSQHDGLSFVVDKDRLRLGAEVVFQDTGKDDSLAALFFDHGITSFAFKPEIVIDDVLAVLESIRNFQNRTGSASDLATLLWEANVTSFVFKTVEDVALSEYSGDFMIQEIGDDSFIATGDTSTADTGKVDLYESLFVGIDHEKGIDGVFEQELSSVTGRIEIGQSAQADNDPDDFVFSSNALFPDSEGEEAVEIATATNAMGLGDTTPAPRMSFDTGLILNKEFELSNEEQGLVRAMLAEDALFDMYASTVELLKEMLHQETELTGFDESVTICERKLSELLSCGRLTDASDLLSYFVMLESQVKSEKPAWADRLRQAVVTAASKDRLKVLGDMLNENEDIPAQLLVSYLSNFGWEALSNMMDLASQLSNQQHREALINHLVDRGRNHIPVLSRNISDKRWYVVRNTVAVLARIGSPESLAVLRQTIDHEDDRVRLELVSVLVDCPSDDALELLKKATSDSKQEIRSRAVASIVARRGPTAFEAITEIIGSDHFESMDRPDQQELLTAYSILGGDHAVDYLAQLINRANPFKDSTLSFFREAAYEALAHNRSERAEKLLVKLAGSWRPEVKRLASQAVKRRREIMFGGIDG